MRFCDLQKKDVINICDCKRLGNVADLELDPKTGRIEALILFCPGKFWGLFEKENECIIPWCDIRQIGPDIILVEVPPDRIKCH